MSNVDFACDKMEIKEAIKLAQDAHYGEWRKNAVPIPYMAHIYDVMRLLARIGIGSEHAALYATAALHDVVESGMALGHVRRILGDAIAENVDALTFEPMRHRGQKRAYMESFASKPLDVWLVKVADRLCNVRDFLAEDLPYARKYFLMANSLWVAARGERGTEVQSQYGTVTLRRLLIEIEDVEWETEGEK